ncbi:glycerophosphodiester phosphodiesterase [Nocardiopsis sp. NPDC006938]|uniref:glycerophosphodiester phosphodiesterase n=1 Tax=Nocardiopsis sp. NPDC006938 TaxID=3364337 RepID=UPI0036B7286D
MLAMGSSPGLAVPNPATENAQAVAAAGAATAQRVGPGAGFRPPQQPSPTRPLIAVAHRGASGHAPENTLAAIDEAHRLGAEAVEVDVQLTSDDRLVLMHDTTLGRTTDVAEVFPGRAPYDVGDFTLAEIRRLDAGSSFDAAFAGERVPLLGEALDRLEAHGMNLLLEVKEPALYPGIENQIAEELARNPHWLVPNAPDQPHRIVVQSFDWESTERSKDLLPTLPHALLGRVPEERIGEFDWAHMINPNHTTIDADYVGRVHDAGLEIMPYTINDPADMGRVLDMGVDGFITDFPDRGQRAIAEYLEANPGVTRGYADERVMAPAPG